MIRTLPIVLATILTLPVAAQESTQPEAHSNQAPEPKSGPAAEIMRDFESGNYSKSLRTAERAAKDHPQDAHVRFLYGVSLMTTLRNQDAAREFEKVIELEPGYAQAYANLGLVKDLMGDEKGARELLEKALKLDPENADARTDLNDLIIRQRIRGGAKSPLPEGSAAQAMHGFLGMVERAELGAAFGKYMDSGILDKMKRQLGQGREVSDAEMDDVYRGLQQGFAAAVFTGGGAYRGFDVQASPGDADTASVEVDAWVLIEKVTSAQDVAKMKRFMNSPELAQFISPDLRNVFMGLEPQDRQAFFDRLEGHRQNQLLPVRFKTRKDAKGEWRIQDAVLGRADLVQISILDALDKIEAFARIGGADTGLKSPRRRSTAYEMGYQIGYIVGIALVVLLGIFLLVKLSRRRAR